MDFQFRKNNLTETSPSWVLIDEIPWAIEIAQGCIFWRHKFLLPSIFKAKYFEYWSHLFRIQLYQGHCDVLRFKETSRQWVRKSCLHTDSDCTKWFVGKMNVQCKNDNGIAIKQVHFVLYFHALTLIAATRQLNRITEHINHVVTSDFITPHCKLIYYWLSPALSWFTRKTCAHTIRDELVSFGRKNHHIKQMIKKWEVPNSLKYPR